MQGVTILISACTFLATLAMPAALLASEEPDVAPPPEAPEAPAEGVIEPASPPSAVEPAPAAEKPAGKDESAPPPPDPGAGGGEPGAEADQTEEQAATGSGRSKRRRGKDGKARSAAVRTVLMRNIRFNPRDITVAVGDTVRWENRDVELHNAIGRNGSFDTPLIDKGETSQHTFNRPGEFRYFCTIHAGMTGTVTVAGSGSGGGGTNSGGAEGTSGSGASGSSGVSSLGGSSGSTDSTLSGGGTSTSSLPATGLELIWLVLAGVGLLTLGAAIRTLAGRTA